ncbi:hypothetical protein RN001_004285 [Aquatica leii]|uniref:Uncharacterized protein n=1 Tax=Aquatica leii TaxID=1421715 RepID=A0AAN7SA12_9COLE|nr:hypothetical protein RN001_004285 [Aquatica leii]
MGCTSRSITSVKCKCLYLSTLCSGIFKMSIHTSEPVFSEIAEEVSVKLEEIWNKASILIISHNRILELLNSYHDKYMKLKEPFKDDKIKSKKVSVDEQEFLLDQRGARKMVIGAVDVKKTKELTQREESQNTEATRISNYRNLASIKEVSCTASSKDLPSSSESNIFSDSEFELLEIPHSTPSSACRNPTCNYGAKHLLKSIRLSRYLEKDLRDIVDPVIQRNVFFGHHENIILSMISDERKHIRELGLRRILKAISVLPRKTKNVRVFKLSALCFKENEYFELIDWQKCEITEPPILSRISTQDLKDFINNPESSHRINFEKYPRHTQCVERCVKLVTKASQILGMDL